ncbi:MAG: PEP-CTERM sorting domain-containing protein [Synechococcales cyanobacterium CRU_2_2]|nr:PEP-CTERM sorting domain-containing protein [Synechococcales cyanobacterium CRU_2_2]
MALTNLLKGSLVAAGLVICAAPAQAAGFSQFTFSTAATGTANPKGDIMLQSVTKSNGTHLNSFNLVTGALIQANTATTGTQQGPGSTDHGDDASGTAVELPNEAQIVASLGNLNLNNIIDTEDSRGKSIFDVVFDKPVNSFFFWERGMNSDLHVEALDSLGNVIAGTAFEITRDLWQSAGYKIDTTEIGGAQNVGSYGLKFGQNVAGLRLSSFGAADNGPDYKVVAAKTPEASSMAALGLIAGSLVLAKRRQAAKA